MNISCEQFIDQIKGHDATGTVCGTNISMGFTLKDMDSYLKDGCLYLTSGQQTLSIALEHLFWIECLHCNNGVTEYEISTILEPNGIMDYDIGTTLELITLDVKKGE